MKYVDRLAGDDGDTGVIVVDSETEEEIFYYSGDFDEYEDAGIAGLDFDSEDAERVSCEIFPYAKNIFQTKCLLANGYVYDVKDGVLTRLCYTCDVNNPIVLSDFCKVVGKDSIRACGDKVSATFVIDDVIEDIDTDAINHISYNTFIDVTKITRDDLLWKAYRIFIQRLPYPDFSAMYIVDDDERKANYTAECLFMMGIMSFKIEDAKDFIRSQLKYRIPEVMSSLESCDMSNAVTDMFQGTSYTLSREQVKDEMQGVHKVLATFWEYGTDDYINYKASLSERIETILYIFTEISHVDGEVLRNCYKIFGFTDDVLRPIYESHKRISLMLLNEFYNLLLKYRIPEDLVRNSSIFNKFVEKGLDKSTLSCYNRLI